MQTKEAQQFNFDFEKLDVYKRALDFIDKVFDLTDNFSRNVQFSLGGQFRRAALSIINNIAEGSGKKSKDEKRRFYRYSLDSARECVPMITICLRRGQIDRQTHDRLREDCIIICQMLAKLILATK